MAGLDLSSLSGLTSNLSQLVPDSNTILQNVAVSAASGIVLAGLKSQVGSGALDPLGIFHGAAASNNPSAVVGPTITASAFSSLTPAAQSSFLAAGGHIIAG
jgi:hypothetical protein